MTNRMRWLVTLAVSLLVVLPAVRPGGADGFPISTYPMFTSDRGRVMAIDTVVLMDGGRRQRLSPTTIGGTDEIVLAAVTVSNAIHDGPAALERLCREVAGRVDEPGTIEVITETHDTVDLLQADALPLEVRVHARCPASS